MLSDNNTGPNLRIALHLKALAFGLSIEAFEFRVMLECRSCGHCTRCDIDGECLGLVPIPIRFRPSEVVTLAILRLNILLGELSRVWLPSWPNPMKSVITKF